MVDVGDSIDLPESQEITDYFPLRQGDIIEWINPDKDPFSCLKWAEGCGRNYHARRLYIFMGSGRRWTYPAIYAAQQGHRDLATFLVGQGAKVDASSKSGHTPIQSAAIGGHKEIVAFLVFKGAQLNAPDNEGNTVRHCILLSWSEIWNRSHRRPSGNCRVA
jgi:hypothetical protein